MERVYFDHNATTPFDPELKGQLSSYMEAWGNPSSIHWAGRKPKNILREVRRSFAELIQAHPLELVFTSGGSEANNLAIKGAFKSIVAKNPLRNQILISAVEHPSVKKTVYALIDEGAEVIEIPVNLQGELNQEYYESHLNSKTALVSVMAVNNETGHIFPIKDLATKAHDVGALFHSDCVQTIGKMALDIKDWGVDLASFSGHKFYALNGVGVLFIAKGIGIESMIHGGGQERGRRAGTENLLAIASLGFMAQKIKVNPEKMNSVKQLRDLLESLLIQKISDIKILGPESPRAGNTTSVLIPGVDGETLLMNLDMSGFAVSTGAACSSGSPEPSPVLLAMGLTREEAQSSMRLSLGWMNTEEEIFQFVEILEKIVSKLRSFQKTSEVEYGL